MGLEKGRRVAEGSLDSRDSMDKRWEIWNHGEPRKWRGAKRLRKEGQPGRPWMPY